jgi:hypothetical protein
MMTFLLSKRTYAIRKVQGMRKIRETKNPFQPLDSLSLDQRPFGNLGLKFANLRLSGSRSVPAASYTLFIGKCAHSSRFIKAYLPGPHDGREDVGFA